MLAGAAALIGALSFSQEQMLASGLDSDVRRAIQPDRPRSWNDHDQVLVDLTL
jgi:hypothetical protein